MFRFVAERELILYFASIGAQLARAQGQFAFCYITGHHQRCAQRGQLAAADRTGRANGEIAITGPPIRSCELLRQTKSKRTRLETTEFAAIVVWDNIAIDTVSRRRNSHRVYLVLPTRKGRKKGAQSLF
jgi:hypothetical protein